MKAAGLLERERMLHTMCYVNLSDMCVSSAAVPDSIWQASRLGILFQTHERITPLSWYKFNNYQQHGGLGVGNEKEVSQIDHNSFYQAKLRLPRFQ